MDKLKKQLDFLIKIDEAKEIFRHTKLFSVKRKEKTTFYDKKYHKM